MNRKSNCTAMVYFIIFPPYVTSSRRPHLLNCRWKLRMVRSNILWDQSTRASWEAKKQCWVVDKLSQRKMSRLQDSQWIKSSSQSLRVWFLSDHMTLHQYANKEEMKMSQKPFPAYFKIIFPLCELFSSTSRLFSIHSESEIQSTEMSLNTINPQFWASTQSRSWKTSSERTSTSCQNFTRFSRYVSGRSKLMETLRQRISLEQRKRWSSSSSLSLNTLIEEKFFRTLSADSISSHSTFHSSWSELSLTESRFLTIWSYSEKSPGTWKTFLISMRCTSTHDSKHARSILSASFSTFRLRSDDESMALKCSSIMTNDETEKSWHIAWMMSKPQLEYTSDSLNWIWYNHFTFSEISI